MRTYEFSIIESNTKLVQILKGKYILKNKIKMYFTLHKTTKWDFLQIVLVK